MVKGQITAAVNPLGY